MSSFLVWGGRDRVGIGQEEAGDVRHGTEWDFEPVSSAKMGQRGSSRGRRPDWVWESGPGFELRSSANIGRGGSRWGRRPDWAGGRAGFEPGSSARLGSGVRAGVVGRVGQRGSSRGLRPSWAGGRPQLGQGSGELGIGLWAFAGDGQGVGEEGMRDGQVRHAKGTVGKPRLGSGGAGFEPAPGKLMRLGNGSVGLDLGSGRRGDVSMRPGTVFEPVPGRQWHGR